MNSILTAQNPCDSIRVVVELIHANVILGKNCQIDERAEVGRPPRGKKEGELPTILGDDCKVMSGATIYAGATLGNGVFVGHNALIREDNTVGDNSSIGTNSELAPGNKVGSNTRIHSQCFLEMTTIGSNIFIAPQVVFTDEKFPPTSLHASWVKGATVEDGVVIGAGSKIAPGVTIGKNALIGLGSVVTRDIPAGKVAVGVPARVTKDISELIEVRDGKEVSPYAHKLTSQK